MGFVILIGLNGCSILSQNTRVVLIPETEPLQLAEDVEVFVYIRLPNGDRVKATNPITAKAGWWLVYDPE